MSERKVKEIYRIAKEEGVNPKLLHATAIAESNMNNAAHRPEPGFWKMYMRQDLTKWRNEFKKYYKTIEPTEEMLVFLFASSYGMCQIMYTTALSNNFSGHPVQLFEMETNLRIAARYLKFLFSRFGEIRQCEVERMKFAMASYNAGRGNINKALRLAREAEGKTINQDGNWQKWDVTKKYLSQVTGDNAQITHRHIGRIDNILSNK